MSKYLLLIFCSVYLITCQTHTPDATANPEGTVCLSLNVLLKAAKLKSSNTDVINLGRINYLEGFVIDEENSDIVLFGKSIKGRPFLSLDDLVVNIRNVWKNLEPPYCSLDPKPENVTKLHEIEDTDIGSINNESAKQYMQKIAAAMGDQFTVIGGVPKNSLHAHTMIDADYIMKKYSQGLIPNQTVKSSLTIMKEKRDENAFDGCLGSVMSRFWFHIYEGDPLFSTNNNLVQIDHCSVVVLTEKQVQDESGELVDSVEEDPIAEVFAQSHSAEFGHLAQTTKEYAYLENLYRLQALLKALNSKLLEKTSLVDLSFFLNSYMYRFEKPMPQALPCLTNYMIVETKDTLNTDSHQEIHTEIYFPSVVGGVSMEMDIDDSHFKTNSELTQREKQILASRPRKNSLVWNF